MTTHFTSGVTNVGASGTSGKLKMPAPQKYHTYFNDFDTYLASDWTITTTEGGSGNASEALGDGDGGLRFNLLWRKTELRALLTYRR